ncbi:hypothetical protein BS47DRAFT_1467804 [Hydnum rufescens UP504]|uniref:Uncharacterized protein n=1 Tax=Hydnum rufescens UP504 TaxID=1448309 RepID=A0A9P6DUJ7_9AGAM|nr:hypothetical protein BS47DRAFT_1467804 [Hydnum rufescens UP504]
MPSLELSEARTQREIDIPLRPSNSGSTSTRVTPADKNSMTLKEIPLVFDDFGLKMQSPGTVLFQTSHVLADTFLPEIPSPFRDEAETKETPGLNDSPSSISLTVLSSPVISSSVTLEKVAPMFHEEVLPEISRGDAEPDTITLIEGGGYSRSFLTLGFIVPSVDIFYYRGPDKIPRV